MTGWPTPPTPRVSLHWAGRGLGGGQAQSGVATSTGDAAPDDQLRRIESVVGAPRVHELFGAAATDGGATQAPTEPSLMVMGDNLRAAEILQRSHLGQVALLYLDPPFNIGTNTTHYDDAQDRVVWLQGIADRLAAFRPLLRSDAVVVAQIDKREQATLRILLDEALGASTFVCTIAVRMSATSGFKIEHTDRTIVKNVEFLHVYSPALKLRGRVYEVADYDSHYSLILHQEGERRTWGQLCSVDAVRRLFAQEALSPATSQLPELYRRSESFRSLVAELGDRICRTHTAPAKAREAHQAGELEFPDTDRSTVIERSYGDQRYYLRRTRTSVDQLIPISLKLRHVDRVGGPDELRLTNIAGDLWDGFHLDMGNVDAEAGGDFKHGKKPERLLRRIIELFTDRGDLVMDPYSGTGTTAAVACKLGRRFLAIEQGAQAGTHALPRLRAVVHGEDEGGITRAVGFRGGGSFEVMALQDHAPTSQRDVAPQE